MTHTKCTSLERDDSHGAQISEVLQKAGETLHQGIYEEAQEELC